jgi:structural maintenance of chromosome 1
LFAIHHFKPSPFYILDEVDDALDNANVNKISTFINKKSKQCQFLVISLKDSFFSKADSLIGIYKDKNDSCSKSLTFDLLKYKKETKEIKGKKDGGDEEKKEDDDKKNNEEKNE